MSPEENFTEVYDKYADLIFRHCFFRVHERELAKELMQETFIKGWKYISDGKEVENIKALLYKIATNLVIDHSRREKNKKRISLDYLLEQGFEPGEDKSDRIKNKMDAENALTVVTKLKNKYQEVVLLRYVEDLSIKEIEIIDEKEAMSKYGSSDSGASLGDILGSVLKKKNK